MYPQAVELDPMMLNLARDYFTFTQDKTLKVTYVNLNPLFINLVVSVIYTLLTIISSCKLLFLGSRNAGLREIAFLIVKQNPQSYAILHSLKNKKKEYLKQLREEYNSKKEQKH